MQLTFLGTGSAFAPDAFNAGYVIDRRLLLDSGPGAHVLIHRAGHSVVEIEAALITHQHADHTFGLPFVLAARAIEAPAAAPFTIAGPPGFERYIDGLLRLAWGDKLLQVVWSRLQPTFIELKSGDDVELAGYKVHAEEVVHVPDIPCLGYNIERKGVRFGFSGDSGVCEGLDRLIERSDHFLMEMTGGIEGTGHLSRRMACDTVDRYPDKRFYLTHLSDRDPVPGAVLAQDLTSVQLHR